MKKYTAVFAIGLVAFFSTFVEGGILLPIIEVHSSEFNWNTNMPGASLGTVTENGDDSYHIVGSFEEEEGRWEVEWDLTVDSDPFVYCYLSLQNLTGVTQTYIVVVTQPVSPAIVPSSLMGGSMAGSLTDADGSGGATVATTTGKALYNGLIDGSILLPLYPDPASWSVTSAWGSVAITQTSDGLPGPSKPGPAVYNTIGIDYTFTLTPGDLVSFTSMFVVEVPEPGTVLLLGLGGLAIMRKRR